MELPDPIFPAEIITLILEKIDPIVRLSFRAVSLGLMREIKKPARKPTQVSVVHALAREGMYAEALRYVGAAKTTRPAVSLLMAACANNDTAVICTLLNGRLAATVDTTMHTLISRPECSSEVLETVIETVPGLNTYNMLSAAVSAKRVSLVKFILAKKPKMDKGLCDAIGCACSLELLYLLERVWKFPRGPSKTQVRLGMIVARAIRHRNNQDVTDFISSMLLGGIITPNLMIWRGRSGSDTWTLGRLARDHREFAWLQACGL